MEPFGRYELLRKLATGGMGQIFLARQTGPSGFQKLLVVKRILPHLSEEPEFIQMFFDEARIAAVLNHPNIAQLYDLGDVDGVHFIAMEYVHGESVKHLARRAKERGVKIPIGLKCRIIADAAAGLDAAHRAKSPSGRPLSLIHRDVSPQNILVGFNGSVKLIDFGVAKAAGKISTTMTGAIKGKYAYMSPEQARGQDLDHRSDIYGLGTCFYELLTGVRLFKRESDSETLKAVVGAKIVPPSQVNKDVPKALDAIVLRALSRSRDERYPTAGELQLAIEELTVEERLPSTAAHLSAFLSGLYAAELADDKFASEPTQINVPSGSRSQSLPRRGASSPAARPTESGARPTTTQRTEPDRPSSRTKTKGSTR